MSRGDNALRHMMWFLELPCAQRGIGLNDPCGSLQDRRFSGSMAPSGTQAANSDLPVPGCVGKAARSPWQCWALALYLWFFSLDYLSKRRDSQEKRDQEHELEPNQLLLMSHFCPWSQHRMKVKCLLHMQQNSRKALGGCYQTQSGAQSPAGPVINTAEVCNEKQGLLFCLRRAGCSVWALYSTQQS